MNAQEPTSRVAWLLTLMGLMIGTNVAEARDVCVIVSDDLGDSAALYKLTDLNGDGDALDTGEHVLWANGLSSAGKLRRFRGGVLTVDNVTGELVHFIDRNGDGDALDFGESTIWSDGLVSPIGLEVSNDTVFVNDSGQLLRIEDLNGDGDALDFDEQIQIATGLSGTQAVLARQEDVLVGTSLGLIHQLIDRNGDGDALDPVEHLAYAAESSFEMLAIADSWFLSSSFASNRLLRVQDRNGDGDALDLLEAMPYADALSGIDGPLAMVESAVGGVLLVENRDAEVTRVRDRNGDGDAFDVGEVVQFGDGFVSPVGIIVIPEPPQILLTVFLVLSLVGSRRRVH